jgi:hypothetical protein
MFNLARCGQQQQAIVNEVKDVRRGLDMRIVFEDQCRAVYIVFV